MPEFLNKPSEEIQEEGTPLPDDVTAVEKGVAQATEGITLGMREVTNDDGIGNLDINKNALMTYQSALLQGWTLPDRPLTLDEFSSFIEGQKGLKLRVIDFEEGTEVSTGDLLRAGVKFVGDFNMGEQINIDIPPGEGSYCLKGGNNGVQFYFSEGNGVQGGGTGRKLFVFIG